MNLYTKVKDCPPRLGYWLKLINSVPLKPENYLPSWDIFVGNAYSELTKGEAPPSPDDDRGDWEPPSYEQQEALEKAKDKATETLKEKTLRFPDLHDYLFKLDDSGIQNNYDRVRFTIRLLRHERSAYLRFQTFQLMRSELRKIAQSCMNFQESGKFTDFETEWARRFGFERKDHGYRANFIIRDGVIDFEAELIDTLRGIPAERLKNCPICKQVFWAKKLNAKTCGEDACVNGLQNKKKKERKGEAISKS